MQSLQVERGAILDIGDTPCSSSISIRIWWLCKVAEIELGVCLRARPGLVAVVDNVDHGLKGMCGCDVVWPPVIDKHEWIRYCATAAVCSIPV